MTDPETGTDDRAVERSDAAAGCSCGDGAASDFDRHVARLRREYSPELIQDDGDAGVLETALPPGVQTALGRFLGVATVRTLGDWVREVKGRTGGGAIAVGDLCHERRETPHWGELDGERYHFTCFFDAVVLAALADAPVDVRTEAPDGTVIEATVTGDGDVAVEPSDALVSVGIRTDPSVVPDGEPTHEDVYTAVCPVVKAFPSPTAYESWRDGVRAATVGMPLADATALATALAE
jgi:hypothetical protein